MATQCTPLAKRFAKIGVDTYGVICHTGKDLHPEAKRLSTLAYYKLEKDVVEFFEGWPAEADHPTDRLLNGSIDNLEPTGYDYDPNDSAPWAWDLEPDLFQLDINWSDLLSELQNH